MNELHGLLLVNKDSGLTSHDVVAKARKIFQTKEVGHCGTLDPMASGLLVLLLGQATKLSQYILDANKAYRVGFKLGFETDTLDMTGQVLKEFEVHVPSEKVIETSLGLQGEFNWPVPAYSAIKVDGEKLYEKARRGDTFEPPLKLMKFWNIKQYGDPIFNEYFFDLECSKGSYIRTWVQELGRKLGCGATMSFLTRTGSDPFKLEKALSLPEIAAQVQKGESPTCFIPLALAMPQVKRIRVKDHDLKLIQNGQISYDLKGQLIQVFQPGIDEIVQILDPTMKLLAIIGHEREKGFHIKRVFKY